MINLKIFISLLQHLPISIGGIPKTIDNDIAMVDRSFGFETAVQECTHVIRSALVEAMSCEYGVGIVKLMGRDAGFIAGEDHSISLVC